MKINKHIVIVSSSIVSLSSMGIKSRDAAYNVLSKHYQTVQIKLVDNVNDLDDLVALKPDLVFLGMKFLPADPRKGFQDTNKIWISKFLDKHDILYTGSNQMAHALELEKPAAKDRMLNHGLSTSPYFVVRQNESVKTLPQSIKFPLFVKPTDRGGGLGIDSKSVVHSLEELNSKIDYITSYIKSDSLVEVFLPGREISVAILKRKNSKDYFVMPIERIVPADENGVRILSPDLKHADAGLSVAVADGVVKDQVTELALQAFHALGARDFGRIDIRLDDAGNPYFLEANLIPSLIEGYGNFPKSCVLNISLNYEDMILKIIELAFMRSAQPYAQKNFPVHRISNPKRVLTPLL